MRYRWDTAKSWKTVKLLMNIDKYNYLRNLKYYQQISGMVQNLACVMSGVTILWVMHGQIRTIEIVLNSL